MGKSMLFFATNRNLIERNGNVVDFGDLFNPINPQELRFGYVETDDCIPNGPVKQAKTIINKVKNSRLSITIYSEPKRFAKDDGARKIGSKTLFNNIAKEMSRGVPTLVFIHGYANKFREAVAAGIALQELLRKDGLAINVVLFTWPSDGSNLQKAYFSDRQDASTSGMAFARGFMKLRDFLADISRANACNQPIHLLCHSMGNYVLEKTLREIHACMSVRFPRVFDEIILAAADVDYDAFEYDHKLARLPELGKRVNVYFNRGDKALVISDLTKGNPDRLGHKGPRKPMDVSAGVVLLDCSEAVKDHLTSSEHAYFFDDRIRADIVNVLKGNRDENIPGRTYVASANTYLIRPADNAGGA